MSVVTTGTRPATLAPTTFDQIQPGQTFWTGDQWNTALHVTDGTEPGTITIRRLTPAGITCTTDYRHRRQTSIRRTNP